MPSKSNISQSSIVHHFIKKRWLVWSAVGILAVIAVYYLLVRPLFAGSNLQLVFYTVKRGDLPITVTERGTIESQKNVKVLCEVGDIPDDGMRGTPLLWIIPNGATVTQGKKIVEFESERHIERRDRQLISVSKAKSDKIEAEAKYKIQVIQNKILLEKAKLDVDLAELEMKMFTDTEKGTHKLETEEIKRKIDDVNTKILTSKATLELAKKDLHANKQLFKMGYAGKSDLDRSRLDVLSAESDYAAKLNELKTQQATLDKKTDFEKQKQLMTLDGNLSTAKGKREQVVEDNKALLAQAKGKLDAATETLEREQKLLARYEQMVENCTIDAPASGMIAYAGKDSRRFWLEEIRQGAPVNTKQHILSIPDLTLMQVATEVHESVIDQVREGLKATIHMEAFPDKKFSAKVKSVAVLADQQTVDTRVYKTIVTIDGTVDVLKPGMTAVVDIHVDLLEDVLSVPVQAVVQISKDSWCFVDNGNGLERRKVELGRTNHKFVAIRAGIDEGDRVVLNPMIIVDQLNQKKSDLSPEAATPPSDATIIPKANKQRSADDR